MTNKGHKKTKPSHIIDPGFSSVVCNFSSINKKESKLLNQASVSESSKKKEMDIEKVTNGEVGCSSTVTQLRGVDERAEEFITRFKEEMRRQRQRSFGEFEEMLARSA
ncbi:hypothetical protein IFM89_038325 [Coptis chinensis]|uniref:Uncharacterized protein n=1 Tax=Coptis chinensis TaxID=261450 RepID=A0A835M0S3_9MAGN|nr:hypothetical protein IFM89_038325 [Coptis chinensis]